MLLGHEPTHLTFIPFWNCKCGLIKAGTTALQMQPDGKGRAACLTPHFQVRSMLLELHKLICNPVFSTRNNWGFAYLAYLASKRCMEKEYRLLEDIPPKEGILQSISCSLLIRGADQRLNIAWGHRRWIQQSTKRSQIQPVILESQRPAAKVNLTTPSIENLNGSWGLCSILSSQLS